MRRPAVTPVAGRTGGLAGRVALLGMSLGGNARQSQATESQAEALGVEGLDLGSLTLQEGTNALRTLVLQGQHFLLDLEKEIRGCQDCTFTRVVLNWRVMTRGLLHEAGFR